MGGIPLSLPDSQLLAFPAERDLLGFNTASAENQHKVQASLQWLGD